MNKNDMIHQLLTQRFGKDSLIALATVENGIPHVRTVDAVYIDGAFYVVTYALSGKMQQIARNPRIAVSGDWFKMTVLHTQEQHIQRILLELTEQEPEQQS